jgi:hypothetical protein
MEPLVREEGAGFAGTRAVRFAALVALVWFVAIMPFACGVMECPTARLFHVPCPGCGMTRAFRLLFDAQFSESLAMHPLAFPTALSQAVLAIATIVATLRFGAPWLLVRARWGRAAVLLTAIVMAVDIVLWGARALGAFGGPVPV